MDVRPATESDIRTVVGGMWQRGAEELARCNHLNKEGIGDVFLSMAKEYAFSFYHDEKPAAVFGAVRDDDDENLYYTWFAATDAFELIGRSATVFLRRFLKEKTAERPEATLELLSMVDHPKADQWFAVLGFSLLSKDQLFRKYRYAPKRLT